MSIITDLEEDYELIDGIEQITLTLVGRNPAEPPIEHVVALSGNIKRTDIQWLEGSTFGLSSEDLAFSLWSKTMIGITPREGDTITRESGEVYRILNAQSKVFDTKWYCLTRKQV